jgi:NTE family protein
MTEHLKKKYKLGLALSGGGARGFAHIGVFRLLEECGLRPDIIAGTSVGALMGALYADGYRSEEIRNLFSGHEFSEFASMQIPKMGLFDSRKFHRYIRNVIRAKRIEELQIPLVVMTTDLDNGSAHAFTNGELSDAITASCSVPILFNPVHIQGAWHVDGGLFHNFPVSVIRNECETVIGSNVSPSVPGKYNKTLVGIAERSYHYLFRANTEKDRACCDLLIETDEFANYKMFDLKNVTLIADIGYRAAVRAFDEFLNNRPIACLIKSYATKVAKQRMDP